MTAARRHRRARLTLACAVAFFTAGQLASQRWLDPRPFGKEPEYEHNLTRLRARIAEKPGRPLVLMMGTSRPGRGFRPQALPALPGDPLVFTFAQSGSGPIWNLLWLRRLLDQGIRPTHVILETWPPFWCRNRTAEEGLNEGHLATPDAADLRFLTPYASAPGRFMLDWGIDRVVPLAGRRRAMLRRWLPAWSPTTDEPCDAGLAMMDDYGWRPERLTHDPAYFRQTTAQYRKVFTFLDTFQIPEPTGQALRDTLALCRREKIGAVLLLMPEPSFFSEWYTAEARAEFGGFLTGLSAEFAVPLVDARAWMADDQFADPAHLTAPGADAFTRRFGREVLRPLLGGPTSPATESMVRHNAP